MNKKIKTIFIAACVVCFSCTALHANQNSLINSFNIYSKLQAKKNHKKKHNLKNVVQNKKTVKKKNLEINSLAKVVISEMQPGFDYDKHLIDELAYYKILYSQFGYNLFLQNQKLIETFKDIYNVCMSDLDIDESSLFGVEDIQAYSDFQKLNSIIGMLYYKNIAAAEEAVNSIKSIDIKNIGLDFLFNNYLIQKDPQNAQRILSLMVFEKDDDEDDDEYYDNDDDISFRIDNDPEDYICSLILSYLQNTDFASAEKLIDSLEDKYEKDINLVYLVKYFSKINDLENANRIILKFSHDSLRDEAEMFILDSLIRQKKTEEYQKLAFSSNSLRFQQKVKLISALYENNFEKALKYYSSNDESIIENFVEMLCSSGFVKEAEELVKIFTDELDTNDYSLFLITAYLNNNQLDEAKRIRDDINDDFLDKWLASRIIAYYLNK